MFNPDHYVYIHIVRKVILNYAKQRTSTLDIEKSNLYFSQRDRAVGMCMCYLVR